MFYCLIFHVHGSRVVSGSATKDSKKGLGTVLSIDWKSADRTRVLRYELSIDRQIAKEFSLLMEKSGRTTSMAILPCHKTFLTNILKLDFHHFSFIIHRICINYKSLRRIAYIVKRIAGSYHQYLLTHAADNCCIIFINDFRFLHFIGVCSIWHTNNKFVSNFQFFKTTKNGITVPRNNNLFILSWKYRLL